MCATFLQRTSFSSQIESKLTEHIMILSKATHGHPNPLALEKPELLIHLPQTSRLQLSMSIFCNFFFFFLLIMKVFAFFFFSLCFFSPEVIIGLLRSNQRCEVKKTDTQLLGRFSDLCFEINFTPPQKDCKENGNIILL